MNEPKLLEHIEQLLDEQRFDEAEVLLLEQLDRKSNLAAVYNALAIIAIESYQDYIRAEKYYRKAIELNPESPTLYFNLAILYEQFLSQPSEAIMYYKEAISLDSNYVDAYINLAELCIDLNDDVELAFECSQKVMELEPNHARNLNNLGCLYIKNKQDAASAIPYFEKSVELSSNPATALANLADAYVRCERFDEAKEAYETSLELEPDNTLVCHNYAHILRHHFKAYDEAIYYYRRAIELDPYSLVSYQGLRSLYIHDLHDSKSGVEVLVSAIPYFKNEEGLILEIANIYDFELENYTQAADYYEQVLEINPNNLLALNALAYLNVEIFKNYLSALDYYLRVLEIDNQTPSTYVNIGHLYFYHLADYQSAKIYYLKADEWIQKRGKPVKYAGELYYNLGTLYENYLNDDYHAMEAYEKAVTFGHDQHAEKKLISLYAKKTQRIH
ncbi:MAG: tetratricopeptide repeat protein [Turicibacter sp.]|nr:tetratricopeptide repeat protein [Turicibacter sp.]